MARMPAVPTDAAVIAVIKQQAQTGFTEKQCEFRNDVPANHCFFVLLASLLS